MNPGGIPEEVGKTTRSFFDVLKDQPLSLALVLMNFLLVAYLFYSGSQTLYQRQETSKLIIEWSKETDKILGSCASIDVMKLVVSALERDRDMYRQLLRATIPAIPPKDTPEPQPPLQPETQPQLQQDKP